MPPLRESSLAMKQVDEIDTQSQSEEEEKGP